MPPLQEIEFNIIPPRAAPGPKRKSYEDRHYVEKPPIKRVERSYSKVKRDEVIIWMTHHRIDRWGEFKQPTSVDAALNFKIPERTIRDWWRKRDEYLPNRQTRMYTPHWPDLEKELFLRFKTARENHKVVTTSWFRLHARRLFGQLYPEAPHLFTFSNGWWRGFLRRHAIVKRRITKQATKRPEEYIAVVNKFLQFIRRVSFQRGQSQHIMKILDSPRRRFKKRRILNFDETPIPFEYLSGATWETKGSKTVAGKSDRSGWDKRQATLILYIFADGIQRMIPTIIFHGKPTEEGGQIYEKEKHLYPDDVNVVFNDTAYNNEALFSQWIDDNFAKFAAEEDEEILLVIDAATFHKTQPIKNKLKEHNTTLALIPGGCTSLVQPLDTAINRPFKQWLQEETDKYTESKENELGDDMKWSVGDKRVMITHIVSRTIQRLKQHTEMVEKAFLNCGISVRPDGSEDNVIAIKDIPSERIDFTGWEEAEEIALKPEDPVDSLFDDIELIAADDNSLLVLTKYHEETVVKLKEKLRLLGLKMSGNKAELIGRLVQVDSERTQDTIIVQTSDVDH